MTPTLRPFIMSNNSILNAMANSGLGSSHDLSVSSNFTAKFDNGVNGERLGTNMAVGDLDNNLKNDLVIFDGEADYGSTTDGGSVYIILDEVLTDLTGSGNLVDLTESRNFFHIYNIPQDSISAFGGVQILDYDRDGRNDLIVGAGSYDNLGRTNTVPCLL